MPYVVAIVVMLLAGILFPGSAFAQSVVNPSDGNAWDLYVFGNGRVVFDIMNSIKMLMVPDAGETGFTTLLTFLAVVGFLVLAIGAGFDPGKNLIRMFTYIIVVWMVTFFSTRLTANLNINDVIADSGLTSTYTVTGVPAAVALPAAVTSQVGHYFTRVIETYFTMPGEFKLMGGAGQFDLFGKMMNESTQYVITNPELKRSLSAYVADCVVPAIARNALTGSVREGAETRTLSGTHALLRTTDMMATLKSAEHNSIMTKYYAPGGPAAGSLQALSSAPGFGEMLTCKDAFAKIEQDMDDYAANLVQGNADAWSKAGVMVPFDTAFSSMMASAAGPGGTTFAGFSSPKGFIMQQAFINSMHGNFRYAAAQTGNNEIMQAAAIAQAEQQQKSAWVSAFTVFNNMMGYVFTVLQAFIFAITPFVVVALMIPGVGKTIFVNYAQILIWLTLWMPMLAIINYIMTLFGTDSISLVVQAEGGINMHNRGLITEKTNDLMIAAGFLGTMTPMITWGIVKGAMAFTQFISDGVGSAFANQAGASAATGNLSMNNLSMDNASMNKYNTAMASSVGFQGTNAFTNAGALTTAADQGGGVVSANGAAVDYKAQASQALSQAYSQGKTVSSTWSDILSNSTSWSDAQRRVNSISDSSSRSQMQAQLDQVMETVARNIATGLTKTGTETASDNTSQSVNAGNRVELRAGANAETGGGADIGVFKAKAGADASLNRSGTTSYDMSKALGMSEQQVRALAESLQIGQGKSAASGFTDQEVFQIVSAATRSNEFSSTVQADFTRAASEQKQAQDSINSSLSNMISVTDSFGVAKGMDVHTYNSMMQQLDGLRSGLVSDTAGLQDKLQAMEATVREGHAATVSDSQGTQAGIAGQGSAINPNQYAPGAPSASARAADFRANADAELKGLVTTNADIAPSASVLPERVRTSHEGSRLKDGGHFDAWTTSQPTVADLGKGPDKSVGESAFDKVVGMVQPESERRR